MKTISIIFLLGITTTIMGQTLSFEEFSQYPQAQISNDHVTMKLLLPDPENGSYRATRFDWSGIISSLRYKDHEYFEYWKSTHDPLIHEDLSGPVESSNMPGLGFDDAKPGGKFIRIGVGTLERPDDKPFETFKTSLKRTKYMRQVNGKLKKERIGFLFNKACRVILDTGIYILKGLI